MYLSVFTFTITIKEDITMSKKRNNIVLGADDEPVVEPTDQVEEPVEVPVVDPKTHGWVYPGYDPSRGNESSWYDPDEEVRPRVYHKYAKEDVYQTLYPDLINKDEEEEEPADPETPVEPDKPVDPETPDEPTYPDTPTEPDAPVEP
jgi:hypothetical protein